MSEQLKKIVIVGGGFAGVQAALRLSKKVDQNTKIQLISERDRFEYQGVLYRVVAGHSPEEATIPFDEIFKGKRVEVIKDTVVDVDTESKKITGTSGSAYIYDFLVLGIGAETAYFNIPGIKELSYSYKTVQDSVRLNRHIQETFRASMGESTPADKLDNLHIVIVGGGASGVELAGELAIYTKIVCKDKCVADPSLVTIDLIEAAPRLVGILPPDFSVKIEQRLRSLGVNIFFNRAILEQEVETTHLKDMQVKSKTMIWTAGVRAHHLYAEIKGFTLDKRGRVEVDENLQAKGVRDVYIVGDGASTQYSGTARTAIHDGGYVARVVVARLKGGMPRAYTPISPITALPIGPGWAGVVWGNLRFYGITGWWLHRLADFKVYMTILPLRRAFQVFRASSHSKMSDLDLGDLAPAPMVGK